MVAKDFSSPPLTMRETILDLYARGGVLVFWRGLTASLLGLSHVAVQFPIYEWMKEYVPKLRYGDDQVVESGPVDWMIASAASKLTACTLTYPHEVIRSRMMDVRDIDSKGLNVYTTAVKIVRAEGWVSLYRGMHVSLLRVIPNCCLTFSCYEYFTRCARNIVLRENEDPPI